MYELARMSDKETEQIRECDSVYLRWSSFIQSKKNTPFLTQLVQDLKTYFSYLDDSDKEII